MLLLTIWAQLAMAADHVRDEPSASNVPADAASEQAAASSTLLSRVSQLATRGNLFEPDSVAQILDMKLNAQTETRAPRDCGDGTATRMEITTVTPSEPSWFRELPSGAGHIDIPAFMINPASKSGDPKFEYRVYHTVECRDWPRLRDHKTAQVTFNGLPAFSCLTPSDIQREVPRIRPVTATDGVFLMHLDGRIDDDVAVTLRFFFRAGAACALAADVSQDQQGGYRYLRAQAKYEACREPSDRDFCSKHPNIAWGDRELLRNMVLQAYERCGTIDTFYNKEPSTGEPLAPILSYKKRKRSPCDGL
jgi:hypothetical protein